MPVFSRIAIDVDEKSIDFYKVVEGSEVEIRGARLKFQYETGGRLSLGGRMIMNDVLDNVPYIPELEAVLNGSYRLHRFWSLYGAFRYYGAHYIETTSTAQEDGFFTLDIGVNREIWKQYLGMYIELRNLTNQEGTWWTSQYKIPGTGIYTGLKVTF